MPIPAPSNVNASRGAPMGRCNETELEDCESFSQKVHLAKLVMSPCGAYDQGGAYWGCGSREHGWMYRCYYYDGATGESVDLYMRATTREKAKAMVREDLPNVRFYR